MNSKEVALTGLFGALYAIMVVLLSSISFLPIQIRFADLLLPLSIIFGVPAIIGISVGTIVSNVIGNLGSVDIIGGTIANLIATTVAWKIGSMKFNGSLIIAVISEIIIVTLIVGTYISSLFNIPIIISLIQIGIGSIIAIGICGTITLLAVLRSNEIQKKSKGLK
jgi:hypothetical protein